MKQKFTFIKSLIIILLSGFSFVAAAQTTVSQPGPSNTTSPVPTAATVSTVAAQVLCNGSVITLKGDADPTGTMKYQWWKVAPDNTKKLVKVGTNKDNLYSETSTDAGYYTYQLVMVNSNDCSTPSDPFSVYVLPPLNASVDGNGNVCASEQTTSVLAITGLDSRFEYTYQWLRNGVNATGTSTSSTYTVKETTAGTATYSVKVAYKLNTTCGQTTAPKTITIVPLPAKPSISFGTN